jgi:arginase
VGRGPENILCHLNAGDHFAVDNVEVQGQVPLEVGTSFAVARRIAESVRQAVSSGAFPLVLAGNCLSCVGTLGGLGAPSPAIIWLDAHGDFNTPETTVSGFLDGMALATAVGRCWGKLAATIPGFCPVPEKQVVLVGARATSMPMNAACSTLPACICRAGTHSQPGATYRTGATVGQNPSTRRTSVPPHRS